MQGRPGGEGRAHEWRRVRNAWPRISQIGFMNRRSQWLSGGEATCGVGEPCRCPFIPYSSRVADVAPIRLCHDDERRCGESIEAADSRLFERLALTRSLQQTGLERRDRNQPPCLGDLLHRLETDVDQWRRRVAN